MSTSAGPDMLVARRDALPLADPTSLDPLLDRVGDASFVLLGEASHGTAEFYAWRAELTRRLIEEKGFSFVAVEGDWPDCEALNTAVAADGDNDAGGDPRQVLEDYRRWPTWMWANTEVVRFARWLRVHNLGLPARRRAGFFGLDVYSLWESLQAVLGYLRAEAPEYVERALEAHACLERYAEDPRAYARAARLAPKGCEEEVVSLLVRLREAYGAKVTGQEAPARFSARQNAEVLLGAERYYRALIGGGPEAWNVRDHHMADTLDRLMEHYGEGSKAVVWAHNTHIGDARATDMAPAGLVNLGQLVRERHGAADVVLAGFASYAGTVIAADRWEGRARVMRVPPAKAGSVEDRLHETLHADAALFLVPPQERRPSWLRQETAHRAIGVVYRPDRDGVANYVPSVLGQRYDALLYLDRTSALTPLHPKPRHDLAEPFPATA